MIDLLFVLNVILIAKPASKKQTIVSHVNKDILFKGTLATPVKNLAKHAIIFNHHAHLVPMDFSYKRNNVNFAIQTVNCAK